jgi:hypothetical protein
VSSLFLIFHIGNAPSLDNLCGKVCVLFHGDPNAVCSPDRVRKPLQQLGQECGELQPVKLLASWHTREGIGQFSIRARTKVLSGLIEGLYDPCEIGGLVDPPSGEPSFVAETSDICGRSMVRVHSSASVQRLRFYEIAEIVRRQNPQIGRHANNLLRLVEIVFKYNCLSLDGFFHVS